MKLLPHQYRYFAYERELAARELSALVGGEFDPLEDAVVLSTQPSPTVLERLTYFSGLESGSAFTPTKQFELESRRRGSSARQSTRYSVHGLHEYKGKFNPQVARALLNIFGIETNKRVLDPFCGSGTTLVECAHMGVAGYGTDINPMAVFVANAKLEALGVPAAELSNSLNAIETQVERAGADCAEDGDREAYLASWFDAAVFAKIEALRLAIEAQPVGKAFFLAVASDLLRDYSLQEPADLRIRRRKTPLPTKGLLTAFVEASTAAIANLEAAQQVLGVRSSHGRAVLQDVRLGVPVTPELTFDAAVTSPPYATALPYIDTQRLSLIWLGLVSPSDLAILEADLIGSREIRGSGRRHLWTAMEANSNGLPAEQAALCLTLERALGPSDGFRRRSVPLLIYRYFTAMRDMFVQVRKALKPGAPFGLIVGSNHTVLGGVRFDIDTPEHLAALAESCGWTREECLPLQTYRRYGLHAANAIEAETLVVLRA